MPRISHVVLPGLKIAEANSLARETVAEFLARNGWSTTFLPTVCRLNDKPLMRAEWETYRIRAKDKIRFETKTHGPGGGGGGGSSSTKSTIGLVGVIALSLLAPGVGTALATGALAGMSGLISGAFLAGGSFLLNTLLAPDAAPSASSQQQQTLYSFGAQTNSARPLDPIPVRYGRTKSYLDYAAVPWSEFIGDDQYLNILLVHGLGKYQREQILIEDTVLWDSATGLSSSFTDVEFQFAQPGDNITLFPVNVAASVEVSGQELPDTTDWVGGYIANAAGTTSNAIAIDLVLGQGLGLRGSSGITVWLCAITAEYRPVNSSGVATGPYVQLFQKDIHGSSNKPIRVSVKTAVAPGRYEVRLRRTLGPHADAIDQVNWAGLRSYLTGPQAFPGVTVTAIRMKSTAQLTQTSSGKFGAIDTRILTLWNGSAWVDAATRNPAWATLDIATNTDYGCMLSWSKVDTQALVALATKATTRGDRFDYEFRSIIPATDALDTALAVARSKHRWLGDVLSLVRDEWVTLPQMLLTDREIVRGSFSVDYQLQAADASDAVILEYLDEETWSVQEVQVPADVEPQFATRMQIPGIQGRAHAFRETTFLWKQNVLRRKRPTITTEHDGRRLSLGSVITLQSEIPMEWGSAGDVVAHSGLSLTINPAPTWEVGQSYILLRTPTGEPFGPIKVSKGASDSIAVLNSSDLTLVEGQQGWVLADVLERNDGGPFPSFAIGLGTAWQQRCIVLSGAPDGDQVVLELAVDHQEVHDDSGSPSAVPPKATLSNPKVPLIADLVATLQQNVLEPVLSASWRPAAGALLYKAELSFDGGTTWAPLTQTNSPSFSVVVEPRAMLLGVSAVGAGQGARSTYPIAAPDISYANVVVTEDNFDADLAASWAAAQSSLITLAENAETQFEVVNDLANLVDANFDALSDRADAFDSSAIINYLGIVAPPGTTAAYKMQVRSGGVDTGITLVSTTGGGQIWADADKFLFRSGSGTPFALFDSISGSLYLKGSLLTLGSTMNMIRNPDLGSGALGFGRFLGGPGTEANFLIRSSIAGDTWAPNGLKCISFSMATVLATTSAMYVSVSDYDVNGSIADFNVVPGQRYEASLYAQCHVSGARCWLFIEWRDKNGAFISQSIAGPFVCASQVGQPLSNWGRPYVFGTAPAGAVRAVIYAQLPGDGSSICTLMVAAPYFGVASANQTAPTPYVSKGQTAISGGDILTGSIVTAKLAANVITANELSANSVTTTKIILNGVTTDRIAPSAVTNVVAVSTAGPVYGGYIGAASMTRIADSYVKAEFNFRPNYKQHSISAARLYFFLEARVVRVSSSGTTNFTVKTYQMPNLVTVPGLGGSTDYYIGENDIHINFIDTDVLPAGSYEYKIEALRLLEQQAAGAGVNVRESSYSAGFSNLVTVITEFKK